MKAPHRKTLVKTESWVEIDGWYWCPEPSVHKRVKEEKERLGTIRPQSAVWYSYWAWEERQYRLDARLAHACKDGNIRAPSWFDYYTRQDGGVSIYGKCRLCDVDISDGVKSIIIMEKEL